jgi:hypothetical protein
VEGLAFQLQAAIRHGEEKAAHEEEARKARELAQKERELERHNKMMEDLQRFLAPLSLAPQVTPKAPVPARTVTPSAKNVP